MGSESVTTQPLCPPPLDLYVVVEVVAAAAAVVAGLEAEANLSKTLEVSWAVAEAASETIYHNF